MANRVLYALESCGINRPVNVQSVAVNVSGCLPAKVTKIDRAMSRRSSVSTSAQRHIQSADSVCGDIDAVLGLTVG